MQDKINKFLTLFNEVNDGKNSKKLGELITTYNEVKSAVENIINKNPTNDFEKLISNIDLIYESVVKNYSEGTIEDLEPEFDKLRNLLDNISNILKTSNILEVFKFEEILLKIERTGNDNFDDAITNRVYDVIGEIFTEKKEEIIKDLLENFDYSKIDFLESVFAVLQEEWIIDKDYFPSIKKALFDKYLNSLFPSIKQKMDELTIFMDEKIKVGDILGVEQEKIIDEFNGEIHKVMSSLEAGTDTESKLQEITNDFETIFFNKLFQLCKKYFETKIVSEIDDFTSKVDFDEYEQTQEFKDWGSKLLYISNSNISNLDNAKLAVKIIQEYTTLKKEIILKNIGSAYLIKKKGDLVYFGDVVFPVYKREKVNLSFKLDPKIDGSNVILNYKEIKTGHQIRPSDEKRLRFDNRSYEYTKEDYKKLMGNYENFKKSGELEKLLHQKDELMEKLNQARKANKTIFTNAQGKLESKEDEFPEIKALKEELKKVRNEIDTCIPHFVKVLERFNKMTMKSYGTIPELSSKIKITPYILENLKRFISLASDQIIRQDGIGILEGEAGVGKNILIDIFAHHTHRPVFTFPCNKRASKEDLTYQWLINENGTYKLNSKVFEAIKTPGAILIFDEINTLPTEVIKLLNGLFDYRRTLTMPYDNEHQKAKNDVLIFGTQNPEHYDGTQKLPQDASSRSNKIYIDYPKLNDVKEGQPFVNYDEAVISFGNMPYFYKLLEKKGYSKADIDKINLLKLRKNSKQILTDEEEKSLIDFENDIILERDFIESWNNIFNFGKVNEVKQNYGELFVEGLQDIYAIIKYAHYIRKRYREKKEGINKLDQLDISVSQRDLNKMMGLLAEGKTSKEAFMQVYIPMISDMRVRAKIRGELESLYINNI